MNKLIFYFIFLYLSYFNLSAQYQPYFNHVYHTYSNIPKGFLEAISFTHTRCENITENEIIPCSGMPLPFGIMGVFEQGHSYFHENGRTIAQLSGISISAQKSNVELQILAYARACDSLMNSWGYDDSTIILKQDLLIWNIMAELTEIPRNNLANEYAFQASVYEVCQFLSDELRASNFEFIPYSFDLISLFGREAYQILSSPQIIVHDSEIKDIRGLPFVPKPSRLKSTEYGPAIWVPAGSCNYSSRNGVPVSAITIHTVQGAYAGAISWAQNCNSNVSYHYVIRSSDGQVTQMVLENNKAWHVGTENPYTIGYEHEGYVSNAAWYTPAMYQSSANLSKDIIQSGYGILGLRTYDGVSSSIAQSLGNCVKIKGHQHYPNQSHTDPGIHWNWPHYYKLINSNYTPITLTANQGQLFDSGGPNGNYAHDERTIWVIQPSNATSIQLQFSQFNLENGFDILRVYNGHNTNAPLLGQFTGSTLPPQVTANSGALTLEFRSDCATALAGWNATYSCIQNTHDTTPPYTTLQFNQTWQTHDFLAQLNSQDTESGIKHSFYNVSDRSQQNQDYQSNGQYGFIRDAFQTIGSQWTHQSGTFNISNGSLNMTDAAQSNANSYASIIQNNGDSYLYEWKQKMNGTASNQRAGLHFFCSDPSLPNRGNSYFVYFREQNNQVQIYKVNNDVFQLEIEDTVDIQSNVWYDIKVCYKPQNGKIEVYLDNQFVLSWQDPFPLQQGNAISFRSGGCSVSFDDIMVYKSHQSTENISVGPQKEIRYQSDQQNPSGDINMISMDTSGNWSQRQAFPVQIDWSKPELVYMNDGPAADLDTLMSNQCEANWLIQDPHSGLQYQEASLGNQAGISNIINWYSIGLVQNETYMVAVTQTQNNHYFNLKIGNQAGLDTIYSTDGFQFMGQSGTYMSSTEGVLAYPNPNNGQEIFIKNITEPIEIIGFDAQGKKVIYTNAYQDGSFPVSLKKGVYILVFKSAKNVYSQKIMVD